MMLRFSSSQNKPKVGLKYFYISVAGERYPSQNKPKVGLKFHIPKATNV